MTPEAKVLKAVTGYMADLKREGALIWWTKLHGGPMQRRGLPDLLVVYEGEAVFMEIKKPGGKATKLQAYIIAQVQAAGGRGGVVTSVQEACELLSFVCCRGETITNERSE